MRNQDLKTVVEHRLNDLQQEVMASADGEEADQPLKEHATIREFIQWMHEIAERAEE